MRPSLASMVAARAKGTRRSRRRRSSAARAGSSRTSRCSCGSGPVGPARRRGDGLAVAGRRLGDRDREGPPDVEPAAARLHEDGQQHPRRLAPAPGRGRHRGVTPRARGSGRCWRPACAAGRPSNCGTRGRARCRRGTRPCSMCAAGRLALGVGPAQDLREVDAATGRNPGATGSPDRARQQCANVG